MISGALRELSAKVVAANKPKVIVKIMYDRGSWEQLWNSHAPVPPQGWKPLDMPSEEEIPGLHLEVIVSGPDSFGSDDPRTFTKCCWALSTPSFSSSTARLC